MKSLRSTGDVDGGPDGVEVGQRPAEPALLGEHADDRRRRRPRSRAASAAGSAMAASAPLDGLLRLTSAITDTPGPRSSA